MVSRFVGSVVCGTTDCEVEEEVMEAKETSDVLSVEKMIRLTLLRENPKRVIIQYYDMDGNLIFELDPAS